MGGISLGKLKAKSEACQITKRNIKTETHLTQAVCKGTRHIFLICVF